MRSFSLRSSHGALHQIKKRRQAEEAAAAAAAAMKAMEELFRPIAEEEEEDDAASLDLTLRLSVGGGVEKKSSRPRADDHDGDRGRVKDGSEGLRRDGGFTRAELPSTEDRSSLARMMLLLRARDRAAKEEEASSGGARRSGASLKDGGGGISLHGAASIPNSNPRHNRIGQHHSLPIVYPYHRVHYVPVPNGIQFPYVMPYSNRNMLRPVAAHGLPFQANPKAPSSSGLNGGKGLNTSTPAKTDSTASSSSSLSNHQSGSVRGGGSTSSGDSRKQAIPEKAEQSIANMLVPTDDVQPGVKSNTKSPERKASVSKTSASRTAGTPPPPPPRRMPLVSATGDGPNGKTITGFLHSYTNSEVRILCVCHGISLTPAEFVGHAGATDVSQPLKQIVVVGDSS
ncbi:protein NINJA homolog 1-like [Zingiber officinale]|uniref:protein NINJA homolog 1-like n=1 Tax=Zingiber officinale TaxID=94328 RepID=UPI001C4A7EE2|nr:protein NINJA homolog 1-like [Zingiber officinale]